MPFCQTNKAIRKRRRIVFIIISQFAVIWFWFISCHEYLVLFGSSYPSVADAKFIIKKHHYPPRLRSMFYQHYHHRVHPPPLSEPPPLEFIPPFSDGYEYHHHYVNEDEEWNNLREDLRDNGVDGITVQVHNMRMPRITMNVNMPQRLPPMTINFSFD